MLAELVVCCIKTYKSKHFTICFYTPKVQFILFNCAQSAGFCFIYPISFYSDPLDTSHLKMRRSRQDFEKPPTFNKTNTLFVQCIFMSSHSKNNFNSTLWVTFASTQTCSV